MVHQLIAVMQSILEIRRDNFAAIFEVEIFDCNVTEEQKIDDDVVFFNLTTLKSDH